jgi:hypothetical protein
MPIPQYYRQISPGIRPVKAAATVAPDAGLGRAVAGLGEAITGYANKRIARSDALAVSRAWRQLDDWRVSYLTGLPDRRKELSQTALDPNTGANRTGYEAELEAFPDQMREQYQRAAEGLSADARAELEARWNYHAPSWSGEAVTSLRGLEMEDVTLEIDDLVKQDRASEAMYLFEQYKDRYSAAQAGQMQMRIARGAQETRLTGAQGYLREVARAQGWEAASKLPADPQFQATWGIDISESAGMMRDIETFVRDEAAMAEAKRKAILEANNDGVLADAWDGKLDLATLPQRVRRNEVDAAVAAQAREIAKRPDRKDDTLVLAQGYDWVRRVREDPANREKARLFVQQNAGALSEASGKELIRDVETAGKPDDPSLRIGVKTAMTLLDEHYDDGTFGEKGTVEAQKTYIDLMQRLHRWGAEHPQAADDEITSQFDALLKSVAKPGWWQRLRSALGSASLTSDWATPADYAAAHPGSVAVAPAASPAFKPMDADIEPLSLQEFYDTVKTLDGQPEAQQKYYQKWAAKWQ